MATPIASISDRERKTGFEPATLTLGKVRDLVRQIFASPLACGPVHPVSTSSTKSDSVVERSTIRLRGSVGMAPQISGSTRKVRASSAKRSLLCTGRVRNWPVERSAQPSQ